jgi:hypothetical protein
MSLHCPVLPGPRALSRARSPGRGQFASTTNGHTRQHLVRPSHTVRRIADFVDLPIQVSK